MLTAGHSDWSDSASLGYANPTPDVRYQSFQSMDWNDYSNQWIGMILKIFNFLKIFRHNNVQHIGELDDEIKHKVTCG